MKITIVLILAALTATTTSQASDRCMWLDALKKYGLDDKTVASLMCVAHHISNFNKFLVKDNFHGVFQVSAHAWCQCAKFKSQNLCHMECSALRDQNLNDDIKCALTVVQTQGYTAWYVWKENCANKDLREYLTCPGECKPN
ncbi:lysozyme C-3-like [Dendropsophus ebraccatus]|uniref:lysozyme C-3-like n=1 Tax=Dendropsophus ebraccatus TaxID=150705 RepID=UPI0038313986